MGVDVMGIKNEEACFCASWWSWRPLLEMLESANQHYRLGIKRKTFEAMGYNDGAGIKSEKVCQQLADGLAEVLRVSAEEEFYCEGTLYELEGKLVTKAEIPTEAKAKPAHAVSREKVKEFIEFLQECGGFCVW